MGKLLRIRALSETRTPTTPAWSAVPVPVIFAGTAGSYTLPVANATSASWVGPGSQPAWLSFVTASPPRITWTAGAPVGDLANVVLRATLSGVSADSAPFMLSVQAAPAATGFFAGFTAYKRAMTDYPRADVPARGMGTDEIKHNTWMTLPNGRSYLFGGDFQDNSTSLGGAASFGCSVIWTLNPTVWTDPIASSGAWTVAHPYWAASGYGMPMQTDKQSNAWDSKRRVVWHIGGMSVASPSGYPWGAPAGVVPFREKVAYFDPAKPAGQGWTSTGVGYLHASNENHGDAAYDPVLDVVIGGTPLGGGGLQIWNPATTAWMGMVKFPGVVKLNADNGYTITVLSIRPLTRTLYVRGTRVTQANSLSPITAMSIGIFKVDLTGVTLPNAGTTADWSSRVTEVWSNPSALILARMAPVIDSGGAKKLYSWLQGPYVAGADNDAIYGTCGHPSTGNGSYGSPNTGVLIDLDTGVQEFTQLPPPTYGDGQGWVLPNNTVWMPNHEALWYAGCAFEGVAAYPGYDARNLIEQKTTVHRKPVPSWVKNLPLYQWYEIPNSRADTFMASDAQAELTARGINDWGKTNPALGPWLYSGGSLRRKDSTLLIHGGGGAQAGRGNMVFGFTMNTETPYWWMPMPPTPKSLCLPTVGDVGYVDGVHNLHTAEFNKDASLTETLQNGQKTPVAIHSYTCLHFLNNEDKWIRVGSQMVWISDGGRFQGVHGFKWSETAKPYASRLWDLNCKPDIGRDYPTGDRHWAKHPWTEDIIGGRGTQSLRKLDAAKGTWSDLNTTWSDYNIMCPPVIDPVRNVIYVPKNSDGDTAHPHWLVELGTGTVRNGSDATLLGDLAGYSYGNGGTQPQWDEDNQQIVALRPDYGLWKVEIEDVAACRVRYTTIPTTVAPGSMTPQGPGVAIGGILSRFQYVPELGGFCLSTGPNRPVWFIKTSPKV